MPDATISNEWLDRNLGQLREDADRSGVILDDEIDAYETMLAQQAAARATYVLSVIQYRRETEERIRRLEELAADLLDRVGTLEKETP